MAEITKDDVVSYIENMSVLDLSNLIKELEEKFGVSAAAVAAAASSAAGAAADAAAARGGSGGDAFVSADAAAAWEASHVVACALREGL